MLKRRLEAQSVPVQGTAANVVIQRSEAPKPDVYRGAKKLRDVENFLYTMEQYFEASGIMDDATKLKQVGSYLKEFALSWWKRMKPLEGKPAFDTWADFKKGFREYFLPADAHDEAQAKLRRLHHKEGRIREYVQEFSELMLEIPDLSPKEAFFSFMDGLNRWAKLELQ